MRNVLINLAFTGKGALAIEPFDKAVTATPREYCQAVVDDISESANELTELTKALSARMTPPLSPQRRVR